MLYLYDIIQITLYIRISIYPVILRILGVLRRSSFRIGKYIIPGAHYRSANITGYLRISNVFYLDMIEIDTVDGSEIWLTSSYGSHTPFSTGFQHHLRWLLGISAINRINAPWAWLRCYNRPIHTNLSRWSLVMVDTVMIAVRLFQPEMQAYIKQQIRNAHPQLYLLKPCKDLTVINSPKTKVASWKIPLFNRKCTSSASHVGGNRSPGNLRISQNPSCW